jgi:hypothetical protein
MKKLFYLLIIAATLASCKKDKDPSLEGKWSIATVTITEYANGVPTSTDTHSGDGRTIDFQSNGNAVASYNGTTDTYPYTMKPDNKVEFDGDIYEIRNLENNSVTLYTRDNWGAPTYYDDILIQMTR